MGRPIEAVKKFFAAGVRSTPSALATIQSHAPFIVEATMSLITEQQKEQFQREGYFILERIIPAEHLSS